MPRKIKKTTRERRIVLLKKSVKWWNYYVRIADLRWADLSEADLSKADLRWANLSNANLSEADLSKADLRWANLSNANLRWANLSNANLSEADLSKANLDFSQLQLSCKTLKTKFDDRHLIQFLYHVAKPAQEYPDLVKDKDLKKLLQMKGFKKVVNKFHRMVECGEIE